MPDREKVDEWARDFMAYVDELDIARDAYRGIMEYIEDALALLREQEAMEQCLKTKCVVCPHCANCDVDENGLLKEQEPVIVRCKDCRHYSTECCADGCGWCECRNFGTNDEWYCADGEAGTYAVD